ncbi:MAG: hypothetical protein ACYSWX_13800 [Planctomycetota bacterium]|jgi:hypothetical protein
MPLHQRPDAEQEEDLAFIEESPAVLGRPASGPCGRDVTRDRWADLIGLAAAGADRIALCVPSSSRAAAELERRCLGTGLVQVPTDPSLSIDGVRRAVHPSAPRQRPIRAVVIEGLKTAGAVLERLEAIDPGTARAVSVETSFGEGGRGADFGALDQGLRRHGLELFQVYDQVRSSKGGLVSAHAIYVRPALVELS